jgi:hypothetical protein
MRTVNQEQRMIGIEPRRKMEAWRPSLPTVPDQPGTLRSASATVTPFWISSE